jgi:hypothetical protein
LKDEIERKKNINKRAKEKKLKFKKIRTEMKKIKHLRNCN